MGAEPCRFCNDELDRGALDGDAERTARLALEDRHDRRQPSERVEHRFGLVGGAHDREVERCVRPASRIARDLASQRARDLLERDSGRLDERTCAVQQHALSLRAPFAPEPLEDPPLRLRPDSRNRRQSSSARRLAKLVGGRHTERAADLHHSFRSDPEEAPEPDELRLHLAFELFELRDVSGLDKLAKARGDAGADAAQLLNPSRGDELGDRRLRLADCLRGSPIRSRRVVAGARQVEEARERLELLGDVGVCHEVSLAAWRRS